MIDVEAVRTWLKQIPGGSLAGRYGGDWDAFAAVDRTVVTLFGSYDTGKSSLLRRILIDSGRRVPDWLTISARHETFEVSEVEVAGCLVRDTPGFTVGATDIRAQNNTRRALAAVGLTDIGIAVLTPQLATAERRTLQNVIGRDWPADALWFVVARFDEAGVDPEYDLDGYRELGARKVEELRENLQLAGTTSIFVVSQDPYQTAGPDTDVDRAEWDRYREWDGMAGLEDAVNTVATSRQPEWRRAAEQRYWSAVVAEVLDELRSRLPEYEASASVAADGVARRSEWEGELDALDRAARASLDGLIDEVVRESVYRSGTGIGQLQRDIQHSLDQWFAKHEARLRRLHQSVGKASDRDRSRPAWDGFASLLETLEADTDDHDDQATPNGAATHVQEVGGMIIGLLKAANMGLAAIPFS